VALAHEQTILTKRPPLVSEELLRIKGCRVVSVADPYGRNLDFLYSTNLISTLTSLEMYNLPRFFR
jgi:hypothetical protein